MMNEIIFAAFIIALYKYHPINGIGNVFLQRGNVLQQYTVENGGNYLTKQESGLA